MIGDYVITRLLFGVSGWSQCPAIVAKSGLYSASAGISIPFPVGINQPVSQPHTHQAVTGWKEKKKHCSTRHFSIAPSCSTFSRLQEDYSQLTAQSLPHLHYFPLLLLLLLKYIFQFLKLNVYGKRFLFPFNINWHTHSSMKNVCKSEDKSFHLHLSLSISLHLHPYLTAGVERLHNAFTDKFTSAGLV